MLTILFDGVAYGMLLFVLACGLSVTLGLMNFINLAHGAFAMAGGYCTVILVNRLGVPFALGLPLAFLATAAIGGVVGAHALRSRLSPKPSRPGAVHHRSRFHVGRRGRLRHGLVAAIRPDSGSAARPVHRVRHRHEQISAAHHPDLRPADARLAIDGRQDAVRQPPARRGRRSARGARASASMSARSSRSRSRSAPGSPDLAARSALKFSASIRPSRSNT